MPTPPLPPAPVAAPRPHAWDRPTGAVSDPWAWLADRDDPDTIAYLKAENEWADAWFEPLGGLREAIFGEIKERTLETDLSVPVRKGGWWYFTRTEEGREHPIHCRRPAGPDGSDPGDDGREEVLLDENVEAAGADAFQLGTFDVSPDHRLLAWSSDRHGEERFELRVRDLATGADLPDVVLDTSGEGSAWSADGRHLFYLRLDEQWRPYQVWRHELGTDPAEDHLVLAEDDERFFLALGNSRSEEWVVVQAGSKTTSEAWLIPAADPRAEPASVRERQDGHQYEVDHWGDRLVVLTNLEAEDFRVMTAPLHDPSSWTELVAHEPGRRIAEVDAFDGFLLLSEWADAAQRLRLLFADGTERVLAFDDAVHGVEPHANPEYATRTIRFTHEGYTSPPAVFEEDVHTGERRLLKRHPVLGDFDPDRYQVERTWAPSGDVQVPVDVVRRRDVPADGTAPAVVYGYGAYEISLPPWFSVARLSLLDRGVVFAVAHVRGGGEGGRQWYLDGKLEHKQHSFDDLRASLAHLVAEGWAAPGRVAIRGGSAGGLLVGAVLTQAPELLAGVLAEVPFVDVVTTMSDPSLPLTVTEWEEWGDPRTPAGARTMAAYSPYDNVADRRYPPVMLTAGLNDPRVSYHEPAKMAAKLRALAPGGGPYLLVTELGAGHRGPTGRYGAWRDEARNLAFLLRVVGAA